MRMTDRLGEVTDRTAELEAEIEEWKAGYAALEQALADQVAATEQFARAMFVRRQSSTITVHPSMILNANDRRHRQETAKIVRDLRHIYGKSLLGRALDPTRGPVHVIVEFRFPTNVRRDAGNFYPTAKALVDGMTDAGIWSDDNSKIMTGPDCRIGERSTAKRMVMITVMIEEQA